MGPPRTAAGWFCHPPRAALVEVDIQGSAFSPAEITIQVGDTVRWTNNDVLPHTSTGTGSGDGEWDSGTLGNGDIYERVFDAAGTFDYICAIHTSMMGTVTVEAPTSLRPAILPDGVPLQGARGARDILGRSVGGERRPAPGFRIPVR